MTLRVEIGTPPRALNPNSRTHWRTKAKYVAAYRFEAKVCALAAMAKKWDGEPLRRCTVDIHLRYRDRRARDVDNAVAQLKPALDGLADAGVFVDDRFVELGAITRTYGVDPGVVLEVRQCPQTGH